MTTSTSGTEPSGAHVSTLALERIATGDVATLPADAAPHVARCAMCSARLASVTAEHARWLGSIDVPARVTAVLRAAAPVRRSRPTWLALGAGACAAACAAVVMWRGGDEAADRSRRKGGDSLAVYRRTPAGEVDLVGDGQALHPGDAVRFRVTLATEGYAGVLGIDAAQAVTAYAPAGPTLERIAGGAPTVFDGSIILDDTLGPERIVLVICDRPRPLASLIVASSAALARGDGDPRRALRVTDDCRETAVAIMKVAR